MRIRRLALAKETLAELTHDDLLAVHAAALPTTPVAAACVVDLASRVVECDSLLRPCISNTCTL